MQVHPLLYWFESEAHLMGLGCLLAHLSQLMMSPEQELQLAVLSLSYVELHKLQTPVILSLHCPPELFG